MVLKGTWRPSPTWSVVQTCSILFYFFLPKCVLFVILVYVIESDLFPKIIEIVDRPQMLWENYWNCQQPVAADRKYGCRQLSPEFNVTLRHRSGKAVCVQSPASTYPSNSIMDPLNLSSSVWPLEGEDDLGLRWHGGTNSGLPTDRVRSTSTDQPFILTFLY